MSNEKRVLGHTFREMNDQENDIFSGAEEGTLIASGDDFTLLLLPNGRVAELLSDSNPFEKTWSIHSVR